jgi:S1-C subfamily serine protease
MNRISKHILMGLIVLTWSGAVSADTKLTRLVKKIRPAVVTVIVYNMNKEVANIGTGFFVDKKGHLVGTGFFVDKKGHLVTNYHVLVGKYSADVRTLDGKTYPVKSLLAKNQPADLVKVLVEIPEDKVQWLKVDPDLPSIAQQVVVVGSPMGLEQTVSEGIVSSIREIPAIGSSFHRSGRYRLLDHSFKCRLRYHPDQAEARWSVWTARFWEWPLFSIYKGKI